MRRRISIVFLCVLFVAAGVNHFVSPSTYLSIMPDYLPMPLALVYGSGFFEIVGGLGLISRRTRPIAGYGLIALLIAVFPANVEMLIRADQFAAIPYWALVVRLPMQALLIGWVWWAAVKTNAAK